MAITVEFVSLPIVVKMIGSKTITMDYSGQTVQELVHQVADKYGKDVARFLLDEKGQMDMTLKVVCNKEEWLKPDQMQRPLEDGDLVTIMMLVAGG
jgi:molybdopterin converting factor small subunit